MADIIGVLSCALHAAHKIYDLSQTIKDAPDVVRTLEKEAGRVEHLLNLVLGTPGSTPQPWGSVDHYLLQGLVEDAEALVTAVDFLFGKTTKVNADGRHEAKKLTWPLYATLAKKLAEKFKAFHLSLTVVCTASTSYVGSLFYIVY